MCRRVVRGYRMGTQEGMLQRALCGQGGYVLVLHGTLNCKTEGSEDLVWQRCGRAIYWAYVLMHLGAIQLICDWGRNKLR